MSDRLLEGLDAFLAFAALEKGLSENTVQAYQSDIEQFARFDRRGAERLLGEHVLAGANRAHRQLAPGQAGRGGRSRGATQGEPHLGAGWGRARADFG